MGRSTVMAPSIAPLGPPSYPSPTLSIRAELDYQNAWNSVYLSVQRLATDKGLTLNAALSSHEVIAQLNAVEGADTAERKYDSRTVKGKQIFRRTLEVISRVGEIVVQGVSTVYPPAELCFNMISWVILAWNTYDAIFGHIASLLERACESLERLQVYDRVTGVDPLLRLIAVNQLRLFVRICDKMIELSSKRNRTKETLKHVFFGESACAELLTDMDKLSKRERSTVAALLYEITSKNLAAAQQTADRTENIERGIEGMAGRFADDEMRMELKDALRKTLDVTGSSVAGSEDWGKAVRLCKNENIDGMGQWLLNHPTLRAWLDGEAGPLLGLQGPHGCGKTFLAANVVQFLQRPLTVDRRTVVGHVCLSVREDSGKNIMRTAAERREMLQTAARALLWQLAVDDAAFLKAAGAVAKKGVQGDAGQLLEGLLLGNPEVLGLEARFVLVVDGWDAVGIDKAVAAEELVAVFKSVPMAPARDRVRVLITGTKELFAGLEGKLTVPTVDVTRNNRDDVRTLIVGRLNRMKHLRDVRRPQVQQVRARIEDALMDAVDGNLARIDAVLDNIGKTDDISEIERQLANVGKGRQAQIEQEIAHLNRVRSPAEITEINELILWIRRGFRWLTVEECDIAVSLRPLALGTSPEATSEASVSQSLMTLSDRIDQKYSLFHKSGPFLDFRLPGTDEILPLRAVAMAADGSRITPSEINMLQHYLKTVCPPDVYDKFSFDFFFAGKLEVKSAVIYKDPDNEHLHLATRCTAALLQRNATNDSPNLLFYAARYLQVHLHEANISLGDRELKSTLGALLTKLFTSERAVVSLFTLGADDESEPNESFRPLESAMPVYWYRWLFCSEGVELIRRWLTDSAGRLKIDGTDFANEVSQRVTSRDLALFLFKAAAKHFAQKLFRTRVFGEDTEMQRAYVFLRALLTTVDLPAPAPGDGQTDDWIALAKSGIWEPTIEHLESVATFAADILGISERDSTWESQTAYLVGVLPSHNLNDQLVKKHARKSLELDPANWSATYSLYEQARGLRARVDLLEKTYVLLSEDSKHMRTIAGKKALCQLYSRAAMFWACWVEHSQTAEHLFLKAVQAYPSELSAGMMAPVLDWLDRRQCFDITMDIFNAFGLAEVREQIPIEEPSTPEAPVDVRKHRLLGAVMSEPEEPLPPFTFFDFTSTVCASESYNPGLSIARAFSFKGEWHVADRLFTRAVESLETERGASAYIRLSNLGYNHALGLAWRPDTKWASVLAVLETVAQRVPKAGGEWNRIGILEAIKTLFITACLRLADAVPGKDEEAAAEKDRYYAKIDWLYAEMLRYDRLPDRSLLTFLRAWNEIPGAQAIKKPRSLFRQRAKALLEMLADDIEFNDMEAYMGLWQMFAAFGDEDNMRVAASLIARDLEKYAEWKKALPEASEDGEDDQDIYLPPEFIYKDPRDGRGGIRDWANFPAGAIKYHSSVNSGSPVPKLSVGLTTPDGAELDVDSDSTTSYGSANATTHSDIDYSDDEADEPAEVFGTVPARTYQFRLEPENSEYAVGRCDQCLRSVWNVCSLWICLDCITNVWLHQDCYNEVLQNRQGFAGCHKTHKMIRMPNIKEMEMDRLKNGEVWIEGEIVTVEEWKGIVEAMYVCVQDA